MRHPRRAYLTAGALAGLLLVATLLLVMAARQREPSTLNDRVRTVAMQLRCPICQGESVYDSPSGLAQSMRSVIRNQLQHGRTPAQMETYFTRRYGQWILLAPPASGIGTLVWLGPPLVVLLGFALVGYLIFRWSRRPSLRPEGGFADADAVDLGLDTLEDQVQEGSITEAEYWDSRRVLVSNGSERHAEDEPDASRTPSGRLWLATALMVGASLVIAGSLSLALHQRGSAAITGSIPRSGQTTSGVSRQPPAPTSVRKAAKLVTSHPKSALAWTDLGEQMLLHHGYSGAVTSFKSAIRLDHNNKPARLDLAFIQIGRTRDKQALETLRPLEITDQSSSRLWMLEGLAFSRLSGGKREAISAWNRFLALNPRGSLARDVRLWIEELNHAGKGP